MVHALLSASSSKQWLNCPPSVRLGEHIEDTNSIYAQEGTEAHEVVEITNILNFIANDHKRLITKYNKQLDAIKQHKLFKDEMLGYAEDFKVFIAEKVNEINDNTFDDIPPVAFEQRVDYSKYAPDGFGTCDVVIFGDKRLVIIDYKYGKGVEVSAEDNSQLKLYALGVIESCDDIDAYGTKVNTVEMIIYQPRLNHISCTEMLVEDLVEWGEKEVLPKALLAYDGGGEFKSGEHCRWCKVKPTCRKLASDNLLALSNDVSPTLSNDEISDLLKQVDVIKNWSESLKDYALKKSLQGESIKDFKLVEGKSSRVITDEAGLINCLKERGFSYSDMFELKLIGIGKIEKLFEKDKSVLNQFLDKPKGAPTLVPITDKRLEFDSAILAFEGVDVSQYD